jgi:hypothetical protein
MSVVSFLQDLTEMFELDPPALYMMVSRVNDDVARIYLVNAHGEPMPASSCKLFSKCPGREVNVYLNEWLISWTSSYELEYQGQVRYRFESSRQIFVYKQ